VDVRIVPIQKLAVVPNFVGLLEAHGPSQLGFGSGALPVSFGTDLLR
jgi:hypothetical protein